MEPESYKPRLIFWEVTKGCNLRCIHCRATATELSSPFDLPKTNALNVIMQVSQYALPILVLSGGEPLFRPDIFELARYATERGLRVALATNGTLVSKEVARQIVEAGKLMDVEVLDHLVLGRQSYVSMKERALGFT